MRFFPGFRRYEFSYVRLDAVHLSLILFLSLLAVSLRGGFGPCIMVSNRAGMIASSSVSGSI